MQTRTIIVAVAMLLTAGAANADTFGTGANQFTMDFVTISGATNPASGTPAGQDGFIFIGVNHDYRMGTYDVTNDQWNKFAASLGVPVTGADGGYTHYSLFKGTDVPVNNVSWYEAAQFVNWLNTSTGHQTAYKFTGTQGTSNYALSTWVAGDSGYNSANPYRNSNAKYYLPTEDEWMKAAYWNGASLQVYATKAGETLHQGNGTNGTGWNYVVWNGIKWVAATTPSGPWNVGSGSQELNGTYDMMGNVWQWMESPWTVGDYGTASRRGIRGGSYGRDDYTLASSFEGNGTPYDFAYYDVGFRVASEVPEPVSLGFFALAGAGNAAEGEIRGIFGNQRLDHEDR